MDDDYSFELIRIKKDIEVIRSAYEKLKLENARIVNEWNMLKESQNDFPSFIFNKKSIK